MKKVASTVFISRMILKLPVMVIGIIIGIPLSFIRSVVIASIEVSDTIMDMVFEIDKINNSDVDK